MFESWRYAFLAVPLALMGLPLYILLPKYFHDTYGLPLATIGLVLLAARILDAIIDPAIGWASDRYQLTKKVFFFIAIICMTVFFNGFFYVETIGAPALSIFTICTVGVYFFFSFIYINYYALGLALAKDSTERIRLSAAREISTVIGIIFASVIPTILIKHLETPTQAFQVFGGIFAGLCFVAFVILPKSSNQRLRRTVNTIQVLKERPLCNMLMIFIINTLPVAITANLIAFYVDKVLGVENRLDGFLVSYFVMAVLSALLCQKMVQKYSIRKVQIGLMLLAIVSFSIAVMLNSSNWQWFYLVCMVSGFALGGELVLLPAVAANIIGERREIGNTFFGFWAAGQKITLAIAAGIFLPLIADEAMFSLSQSTRITICYAVIPLLLKSAIIAYIWQNKSLFR